MLHTDIPIADIAILVGFHSQSHLNRHFKRILKVTPQALRQNKKEAPKKKKVVDRDSWKWLTNYIWIFLSKSIIERRTNIKNESENIHVEKNDLNLYQQIQWNTQNNRLQFGSDVVITLMLHCFVYVVYQSELNEQKLSLEEFDFGDFLEIKPITTNQINHNNIIEIAESIEHVQNVQDQFLSLFLGYEYSSILAILFNIKEPISMKLNHITKVNNESLSQIKKQIQSNEISPHIFKEKFQEKLTEGKFLPHIFKTEFQDKISEGKFLPHIFKEEFQEKLTEGKFLPHILKTEFQDKISEGKFLPHILKAEFQDKISEGKFFDSFTGEEFRKSFDSFSGVDFESSFDLFSDEVFIPGIGLHKNQLHDVDIDIFNKGRNSDLIEFGISKLPRLAYGIASRMELPNNIEFDDFSFGDCPPFLNNFLGNEMANLTETE